MSVKSMVRRCLEKYYNMRYEKELKSRILNYEDWEAVGNGLRQEIKNVANTDELVYLSFEEGAWAEGGKESLAAFCDSHPQALLVYGDEDVRQADGSYAKPWFKPDWSPDSYLCRDYLGGATAVRKELYEQLTEEEHKDPALCHRRLIELAGGFTRGCRSIGHLQQICLHRDRDWTLPDGEPAGQARTASDTALVSVIIPSKDNPAVLKRCLETLKQTIERTAYEIILVDNGSTDTVRKTVTEEVDRLNKEVQAGGMLRDVTYLYEPMEFHFSRMCNLGAKQAKGDMLLFLNDDIEAVNVGWLEMMLAHAGKSWVGAVGCKLLYPDEERIQHVGISNISIGPVHKLQFFQDSKCYYDGRNRGVWNVLAVTGACLLLKKSLFEEVGGFTEMLPVAFNDVDLCFTLHELGYYNVVVNTVHLLHHESLSRGTDESEEKLKRLAEERKHLYKRHPKLEGVDPYYPYGLNQNVLDTRICPAYETGHLLPDLRIALPAKAWEQAREDNCLLLRIELAKEDKLQGYGVVLGSDNACFSKCLLLKPADVTGPCLQLSFTPQYRSDLAENMPDQKNVALCGFCVELKAPLPQGEYRIGMLAKDRISGQQLFCFSNRTITV